MLYPFHNLHDYSWNLGRTAWLQGSGSAYCVLKFVVTNVGKVIKLQDIWKYSWNFNSIEDNCISLWRVILLELKNWIKYMRIFESQENRIIKIKGNATGKVEGDLYFLLC